MIQVEFRFAIGDKVIIIESRKVGIVEGLFVGKYGQQQADVAYSDNNSLSVDRWFDEKDLTEYGE
jgi:hypothetical protein